MYQCYAATDNTDMSIEVLKDILSFDENNEKAIKALASIYNTKKDGTSLNKLIKDYRINRVTNILQIMLLKLLSHQLKLEAMMM